MGKTSCEVAGVEAGKGRGWLCFAWRVLVGARVGDVGDFGGVWKTSSAGSTSFGLSLEASKFNVCETDAKFVHVVDVASIVAAGVVLACCCRGPEALSRGLWALTLPVLPGLFHIKAAKTDGKETTENGNFAISVTVSPALTRTILACAMGSC